MLGIKQSITLNTGDKIKKLLLLLAFIALLLVPTTGLANESSQTSNQLEQSLNDFAKNDKEADFDSATVKGKTITLKVADDYIEAPVKNGGRRSFLHHLYKQVQKIQKKNNTKYSIVIKDDWTGQFAKMDYKGKGWYTLYSHTSDHKTEKCNFATLEDGDM
ncbi:MAG: hypothetical protein ACI4TY_00805 [Candidatus Limosilactobacillus intestinavium]|jgi:hypothetical protein